MEGGGGGRGRGGGGEGGEEEEGEEEGRGRKEEGEDGEGEEAELQSGGPSLHAIMSPPWFRGVISVFHWTADALNDFLPGDSHLQTLRAFLFAVQSEAPPPCWAVPVATSLTPEGP